MCIVCHYRGDNKLVTERGHGSQGGVPILCISTEGLCRDCSEDGVTTNHVCTTLHQIIDEPVIRGEWKLKPCPKCGAEPGELCWGRGFDKWGPRTPTRKQIPCAARRR